VLYKATLRLKENKGPSTSSTSESCICRVVNFDRITNYVIEDYLVELAKFEALKFRKYMVPTIGYLVTENGINIFQPEMISMYELLHCEDK
jgi:hypothetical protein